VIRIGKLIAPVLLFGCQDAEREQTFLSREALLDPETCSSCHPQHYQEWSGSMHAYASFDPVFRAMNARGQEETGGALGDLCANCHAPMAVREGATRDGLDLDSVPKHLQGITCYFCHNVDRVEGTHNNPLVLANDVTMRGGIRDPAQTSAHDSAYSALLDSDQREPSSSLCGSCHDIMMPKELSGAAEDVHLERTFQEWSESVFNDPNSQPLSCGACHLLTESSAVASLPNLKKRLRRLHTFPGVDLALTEFPERGAQREAVQRFLDTSLRIEVCVSPFGDLRVVLESLSPGHNFPTGASQDRRFWVEVRGYGKEGEEQFAYGVPPAGTAVTEVSDAWILRDRAFKANGEPAHMFWDVARPPEPGTILAPITRDPLADGYYRESVRHNYRVPGAFGAARIEVLLRIQPIGLDVLDDLVQSRHLEPSIRDAMPTLDLLPNRGTSSETSSFIWTYDSARADGYPFDNYLCLESAKHPR
jgi:hypothetical protein